MENALIAKRYIKPLIELTKQEDLDNLSELLNAVAAAYQDNKFITIMCSNDVSKETKTSLVLDMVAPADSTVANNLVKLMAENGRLNLLPVLAHELRREISRIKRLYKGRVYCNSVIDKGSIDAIAHDLGKKVGATISLEFVASSFEGVRVEVDDLNIEINFSKNRLNAQLIEHILKAI
ncbi:MAG: F0F1 ATP synthase subunit delta [Sulfuricurvum sp.]|jgi:F-type H+-transporting ATPase subunit delta|uniref:F0F1 ATP synthase subunit delta n=1 Tax=Sulfuricurvum sp. TaxID=2025608 RepID=UPI0025D800AF|nr:F0F1 ATP synthase subunit delta [Sulfuricurvum sp.]MCK9373843.1 F0F1 ATP synthase subunit delta [Sulfuricurvum sp.]